MALKDWKKNRNSTYIYTFFKKNNKRVQIVKVSDINKLNWIMEVLEGRVSLVFKHFKTKSQALRFARAYMKKH